ncbi:MAG: hypothetical protein C4527_04520 [Candidatus Omnitrophota bacterium]|nr:MAG: hypothetical protein C4527_04520 [Candidatus Omnitrophota bacterium]
MTIRTFLFNFSIVVLGAGITATIPLPCNSDDVLLTIGVDKNPSFQESYAAREIARYLYLRTDRLVPIVSFDSMPSRGANRIILAQKERSLKNVVNMNADFKTHISSLQPQQFLLKTVDGDKEKQLLIIGGDGAGTLYGAYRFAELIGVRFYLHGDVIPDEKIELALPDIDECGKPLFALRGIQPFHDFPEGPDWWNEEDYKAYLSQLPKLRMNFFGLHTYPEGHPNAEPTVWIGLPQDIEENGNVKFSYPASYQSTQRGNWGYRAKSTGEYSYGASQLFERDVYAADVMGNSIPAPESLEDCNAVFNRTGDMLREVFTLARTLGVKTCVGTETPLTVPEKLKERMKELGKDESDVFELYTGMFERIMKTYPIDYYWFWTPEGWIWSGVKTEELAATKIDLLAAVKAAERIRAPFTLATCGWVLGPQNDRALFDRILPKEMPLSCINRVVGFAPVQTAFAKIKGRPLWAIPWLEDDPALLQPQLWVGRMRADAVDARNYGCNGLMGIHWRTRVLGPNISALAWAGWDQSWAEPEETNEEIGEGPDGGHYLTIPDDMVDDPLYRTLRVNVHTYRLHVPNGHYIVTLKFARPDKNDKPLDRDAPRMFSVNLQGKNVLDKVDINQIKYEDNKLDYTFSYIEVTDGVLTIEFPPMQASAGIAAIAVHNNSYAKRINCGGPAYGDYQADWPPSKVKPRHLTSIDFYRDWAEHLFGSQAAEPIAAIFTALDGKLPRPTEWVGGPGGLNPDKRPWKEAKQDYAFVRELAQLRKQVQGRGNRDRFDYWLNTFRFMKALARVDCILYRYKEALALAKKEEDAEKKKAIAREKALPIYQQMMDAAHNVSKYNILVVSNPGEMGTIANWEQHNLQNFAHELQELLGDDVPAETQLPIEYAGPPRIIVPTVRTNIAKGETLTLKVIILDKQPPQEANLYWREMGKGEYEPVPVKHVARGVYQTQLPQAIGNAAHLEYYIEVKTGEDKTLHWPATAPQINQTLTLMDAID